MLLAIAVILRRPEIEMPAVTQFIGGSGPLFGGALFPFVFTTTAAAPFPAVTRSFQAARRPKLIGGERDVRLIGYGGVALESVLAVMAMIAATLLEPRVYFAINSSPGVVGATAEIAVATIEDGAFR